MRTTMQPAPGLVATWFMRGASGMKPGAIGLNNSLFVRDASVCWLERDAFSTYRTAPLGSVAKCSSKSSPRFTEVVV